MILVFSLEVGVQVMGDYLEKDILKHVSQFSIFVLLDVSVSTSTGRSYFDKINWIEQKWIK